MNNLKGILWLDGKLISWQEAAVPIFTHTLHYGTGVFEGLRAYKTDKGTSIFRLQDHTTRLFKSAQILNIEIPFDQETLNDAHRFVIQKNNLSSAYIRTLCFLGSEGIGLPIEKLTVRVMIAAWEWKGYINAENAEQGVRVRFSSYKRPNNNSFHTKAKANGHYLNSVLAYQEAKMSGYEDALMLDNEGYVAEATATHLFIVRNGVIYTPHTDVTIEGITRDSVIRLARENGLQVQEKRITRDEVYIADEVFSVGTLAEIVPISEVDGRKINLGKDRPITDLIKNWYRNAVHYESDNYKEWHTLV